MGGQGSASRYWSAPYYAGQGSPLSVSRLSQAKLSRNSNQLARGRIRQFESYMPSHAVSSPPSAGVRLNSIYGTGHTLHLLILLSFKLESIMKKLSKFAAAVSAALVCTAVPSSLKWSPANTPSLSLDTAEARVGRPLTATSVAGVNRRVQRREYRRTAAGVAAGAAVGAAAVGAAAVGAAPAGGYVGGPPYGPGPAVAGPAPYGGPGYGYGPGPYPDAVIVNPVTRRWCRTEPSGYQFCWTP
jgi:hypothetical protein